MSDSSDSEETISVSSSPTIRDEIKLTRKNSIIILNDYEETISLDSSPSIRDETDFTRKNSIRMSDSSYFDETILLNSSPNVIDKIELTRKKSIRVLLKTANQIGVSYFILLNNTYL